MVRNKEIESFFLLVSYSSYISLLLPEFPMLPSKFE